MLNNERTIEHALADIAALEAENERMSKRMIRLETALYHIAVYNPTEPSERNKVTYFRYKCEHLQEHARDALKVEPLP